VSTLAIGGSEATPAPRPGVALRYADLFLLAIALPVFVLADWPLIGYAAVAAGWLAQHWIQAWATKRVADDLAAGERRSAIAIKAWSTLGRVWLVAGTVLAVGLIAEREDGLAAAVLAAALFTVQFAAQAIGHISDSEAAR
jgi:hypothetical protein